MPQPTGQIYTDFSGGMISPKFTGRLDTPNYAKSCRELRNMIVMPQGGAMRRPGFEPLEISTGKVYKNNGSNNYGHMLLPINNVSSIDAYGRTTTKRYLAWFYNYSLIRIDVDIYYIEEGQDALKDTVTSLPWSKFDELKEGAQIVEYEGFPWFCTGGANIYKLHYPAVDTAWQMDALSFTAAPWTKAWCIEFFEQRLVVAEENKIYMSVSGDPLDFTTANGALSFTTLSNAPITWLKAAKGELFFGTSTSEWMLTGRGSAVTANNYFFEEISGYGQDRTVPILANDALIYLQRNNQTLRELIYSNERGGYSSPDLTFFAEPHEISDYRDTSYYNGGWIPRIYKMAFQRHPQPIVWLLLDTGELMSLSYDKSSNVLAYALHTAGGSGTFADVKVMQSNYHYEDQVWVLIKDVLDSNKVYTAQRIRRWSEPGSADDLIYDYMDTYTLRSEYAMYIDHMHGDACRPATDYGSITNVTNANPCVVYFSGASILFEPEVGDQVYITGVGGTTELNGNTYMIKTVGGSHAGGWNIALQDLDGNDIDSTGYGVYTSGGTVTQVIARMTSDYLDGASVKVLYLGTDGSWYTETLTMPSSGTYYVKLTRNAYRCIMGLPYTSRLIPQRPTDGQMQKRAIKRPMLRLLRSVWGQVGTDASHLETISTGDDTGDATPYTGDLLVPIDPTYEREAEFQVAQSDPLPQTILALFWEGTIHGS